VKARRNVYESMTLARLGTLLSGADDSVRWRLVAEFLEEYRWELALSAEIFPEEEVPPRARLILEDIFDPEQC
jgi:hypothetical protein